MSVAPQPMALARGLMVVGDQWNLLIVQAAFERVRRYGEFKKQLGVSDAVLTGRLGDLVADGVLTVDADDEDGAATGEYLLTDTGRDLWSIFVAAWWWAARWDRATAAKATLVHDVCGSATSPRFGCDGCGERDIDLTELNILGSPGATLEAANPPRRYRRATIVDEGSTRLPPELVRVVGDRWSVSVLVAALLGAHRFTDFEHMLHTGPNVISDRLIGFVDAEVLRSVPTGTSSRRDYHIAQKGRDLVPFLSFVNDWSNRWYGDPSQPHVVDDHREHRLEPSWWCDHCDQRLKRSEVHFEADNPATDNPATDSPATDNVAGDAS